MLSKPIDITDSIHKITDFLNKDSNIIFAMIFGSGATGKLRKNSDLDIGIYFNKPYEGLNLLTLINTLSELSGRNVDVVVLNRASAFLRHQVIKYKIVLTIKDHITYRKFREQIISDYAEYKYISRMNVYDR